MYTFKAKYGMRKRNFHVIDTLFVYAIDSNSNTIIPCPDAVTRKIFAMMEKDKFFTKEKYLLVCVTQKGYKIPTYESNFVMELGGDCITKIGSYGEKYHFQQELYIEALGKILSPQEIVEAGLGFLKNSTKIAPKEIQQSIISVRKTKATQNRGLVIAKEGAFNVLQG